MSRAKTSNISLVEYQPSLQPGVDAMMEGIAAQFQQPINGPKSTTLAEAYQQPGQKFWIALDGEKVVGTVGLVLLSAGNAVLKRMMTDREYRGRSLGLATQLLDTATR